jgi:Fe-S-cluster containining protein
MVSTPITKTLTVTECNMCGDCCEDIPLNIKFVEKIENQDYEIPENQKNDILFVRKHWKKLREEDGHGIYECDMFDKESRLCTAHSSRPPVCRDYPWYGKSPQESVGFKPLKSKCSFWQDVSFR